MFGSLGFTEIAFVLVLALLLFGPKRLPEIGKTIGKGLAEFRRASNDLKRTLEREVAFDEMEQRKPTLTPLRSAPLEAAAAAAAARAAGLGEPAPEAAPEAAPVEADPAGVATSPAEAETAPPAGERPD